MVRVVIVNGSGRTGKDTLAELVAAYYSDGPHHLHSTVDTVKLAAEHFGADEAIHKGEKERRLWSDLKDAYTRYNDGPFCEIVDLANKMDNENPHMNPLLFTMVREPGEIAKVKKHFGLHSVSVLVTADERIRPITGNHADKGVFDFEYDIIINNDGTLLELKQKSKKFAQYLSDLPGRHI